MKLGVVSFPGSNCDQDLIKALEKLTGDTVVNLWHKDHDLQNVDFVFLPGGFSFGDYLRSGAIARFSPIMQEVIEFADKGGYVMGICNGFQILCETQLLPGALLRNKDQLFICDNVFVKVEQHSSLLTDSVEKDVLKIPIAHAEGRYFADWDTHQKLKDNNQILLRYCSPKGQVIDEFNPNGSLDNIAGICNKKGNVFGMMPHPERAADAALLNEDGSLLFASLLKLQAGI